MKRNTRIALAFAALAGIAGTAAIAAERHGHGRDGMRGFGMMQHFDGADADSSGDVTLEEFTAAVGGKLGNVDADGNGTMTVEEVADAIERTRNLHRAERIINRLDSDNDGSLSVAEFEAAQQRIFARLDSNNDGKIEKDELPRRMMDRRDRRGDR